jgi:putative hemolysin
MSETALVSTDRLEILHKAAEGNKRAQKLESMLEHPERLLTTILLGNNLVNIGASAIATSVALGLWGNTGIAIATGAMTFVVLVFAEITPKSLAVRRPMPIALIIVGPLRTVQIVLWPLVWSLTHFAKWFLRLFGVPTNEKLPFITQGQIESMAKMGVSEGEVEPFEANVIQEVFEFTETDVQEVMTDRENVVWVTKDATMKQALDQVANSGFSRLPVVDADFDHVLGFVHVKDLLRYSDQELAIEPVSDVVRGVLFTQYDTQSDRVLVRMQRAHKLMAIIQDEDGRNIGIATAEDLLEELVGEITDEFDEESDHQKRYSSKPVA